MDDFNLWTDQDLQKACKFGFVVAGGLIGGAFGGLASTPTGGVAAPLTVPGGAAYGAALGLAASLLACPYVSKATVERFLAGKTLHKGEAVAVFSAVGKLTAAKDKTQVAYLAATVQQAHAGRGPGGKQASIERSARADAELLLMHMRASGA